MNFIKRTPKRLRKDNFNLEEYLKKAAELDIKYGILNRRDYIGIQEAYMNRRNELLKEKDENNE